VDPPLVIAGLALAGTLLNSVGQIVSARTNAKPVGEGAVYAGFKGLVDGLSARLETVEGEVGECHEKHEQCERGRHEDREAHRQEIEAIRRQMREAIDQAMRDGQVAQYSRSDLKRVGKT
jgi:hypothetical protein